jgi:protein-tyrosine phosphatase
MAEGFFRHISEEDGSAQYEVDSAGTEHWNVGAPPDDRARATLMLRGIDISDLRARQIAVSDFEEFDLLLAMDSENLKHLDAMAPAGTSRKVHLYLDYALGARGREVSDPYYGGAAGFDRVCDLVERASHGLLRRLAGGK